MWPKEDDGFVDKLPAFEKRCETPAGMDEVLTGGRSFVFNEKQLTAIRF